MWKGGRTALWIIGLGFLTAPLASIVSGAVEMNRLMFAIPFGALTAAAGAVSMLTESRWTRIAALLLLASVPLQFARFYADYMGPYEASRRRGSAATCAMRSNAVIADQPRGSTLLVYVGADVPFSSRVLAVLRDCGRQGRLDRSPASVHDAPRRCGAGVARHLPGGNDAVPGDGGLAALAAHRHRRGADRTASFEVLAKQPGF